MIEREDRVRALGDNIVVERLALGDRCADTVLGIEVPDDGALVARVNGGERTVVDLAVRL